ncbi:MAG: hypothetical protein PHW84_01995 [Methanosarcina sp.]|nr:hypothetical protein [Methanosarcina sp.]
MPESTYPQPPENAILVKDINGNPTGVYLIFDAVMTSGDKKGQARILVRWNAITVQGTKPDGSIYTKHTYQEAVIYWSLPIVYLKDGVKIKLGTTDSTGKVTTSTAQIIDFLTVNAAEIAYFAQMIHTEIVE